MQNCLAFNAPVDATRTFIARIIVFGHGVTKIDNPGLSRRSMKDEADQNGRSDGKSGNDQVDAFPKDRIQADRNGRQRPADPAVR